MSIDISCKIIKDHLPQNRSAAIQSIALHKNRLRLQKIVGETPVKTEILNFAEKMMGPLPELLTDYLTMVAEFVKMKPWNHQVDIDEALAFKLANLYFLPPVENNFIV